MNDHQECKSSLASVRLLPVTERDLSLFRAETEDLQDIDRAGAVYVKTMEELPTELLEKIFLLLRRRDRLEAALVCKRWAEIVSASRLLRDIRLVLRGVDLERATPTLLDSRRQYANLKICDGPLHEFHPEFWARIAGDLVSLQLEHCDLSAGVFCAILEECQRLQSLEIEDCRNMMSQALFRPPDHICVARVQHSLRNVRHLSLRKNQDLSDALFNQMLTLVPNITSLCLEDYGYPLASLNFHNVLACMMRSEQDFVALDFSDMHINDEALIQIVELCRDSLTSLRLEFCSQLTARAYEAIGECSKLRLLSLHGTRQTNDHNVECILTKTPDLEYLDLSWCELISNQSLHLIVQLKKLRHLNLRYCQRIDSNSLGSLRALTELQHLDLSDTNCDAKAFCQLASLKDLRTLDLSHCVNLDSECFVIICDNFMELEKLDLSYNKTLTDEAVCKFHQLKNLRSLDITGADGISDRSFENGIGASDMKTLKMGWCSWLTDGALVSIATHHVCLEYLDLEGCDKITDVGLISAVQCLPRLRTLILLDCRLLTDRSLHALQDHCPDLRELNVMNRLMSGDAMDLLAHLRPFLSLTRSKRLRVLRLTCLKA